MFKFFWWTNDKQYFVTKFWQQQKAFKFPFGTFLVDIYKPSADLKCSQYKIRNMQMPSIRMPLSSLRTKYKYKKIQNTPQAMKYANVLLGCCLSCLRTQTWIEHCCHCLNLQWGATLLNIAKETLSMLLIMLIRQLEQKL